MRAIRIHEKNFPAIDSALCAVNKDARGHTFSSATELQLLAKRYEIKLLKLVGTKKDMQGAKVRCSSGEPVPNAYRYPRIGTSVTLTRGARAWYLTSVDRVRLDQRGGKYEIVLTPTQSEVATQNFQLRFLVARSPRVVPSVVPASNQDSSTRGLAP
jgi:hypothetical protein